MTPSSRQKLCAPLASRELDGEVLLSELEQLKVGRVRQSRLNDCALELRAVAALGVAEAVAQTRQLASERFGDCPALAALMVRWAARLRTDVDVPALASHLERLALASALIGAIRRGQARLSAGVAP